MDRYLIVEQDKDTNLIIIKKMVRNYEKAIDYMRKNYKQNIKGKILRVEIIGDEFNYVYVYLIKYNIFNKKWAFEYSITNLN